VLKLASLKQQPLLFATILPISSRKKNEAGPVGFGAGYGCGIGSLCFARLSLRDGFFLLGFAIVGKSLCFARLSLRDGFFLLGFAIVGKSLCFARLSLCDGSFGLGFAFAGGVVGRVAVWLCFTRLFCTVK
jgi:hypothetical protein